MFVVAMISQKGGPGKTTIGLNLAVAAAFDNRPSVILDLDPQANAANWKDRRSFDNPAVVSSPPSRVRQALKAAREHGAEFVVIDSPGKADNVSIVAAEYADLVLIPVEAHMSNLETMPGVLQLLRAAPKTPSAFVVVNKIHPSAKKNAEQVKVLIGDTYGIPVCPVHLSQLDVYATSQDTGSSVIEADPKGRAASEIQQLYKFTISQSHKSDNPHVHK